MKKILIWLIFASPFYGISQPKIAILPFSGVPYSQGVLLSTIFAQELAKINVLIPVIRNTNDVKLILKEINFQKGSLFVSQTQKISLGKAWKTRYVLIGKIEKIGKNQIISLNVLDINTLVLKTGETVYINELSDAPAYLPQLAKNIVGTINFNNLDPKLQKILHLRQGQLGIERIKNIFVRELNAGDNRNVTPLMIASSYGYIDLIVYLIDKGVIIDSKDIDGNTALMYAAKEGQFETVSYLLGQGAVPTIKNLAGKTARRIANDYKNNDIAQIIHIYE